MGRGSSLAREPPSCSLEDASSFTVLQPTSSAASTASPAEYKVYKRRFFGLVQLILLNIVISWCWITFAPISSTAATYFDTTESVINWLSTVVFFGFVAATPFSLYALSHYGPKVSIVLSAVLVLVGNWIKYGGSRANSFGVVMLGQLLIGFAQPFILSTPTTYSDLWFSASGRTSATAIASLANPFGAALGQLISPFWATDPSQIPNTVLYTAIIASVASVPAFFIPAKPPTPPTPSVTALHHKISIIADIRVLFTSLEFYLIFIPFSVYVGFFNAFSSLINQAFEPYGFSEDDAGLAGAVLILVGLVAAAITSPIIDKYKFYLLFIKLVMPIIGIMYLVLIWGPPSRSIAAAYVICAILGAASFSLVPVALEFLVEIHYPLGPETSSSLCWCGGQILGGCFLLIMDALKDSKGTKGPKDNLQRALIFEAVIALAVVPLPILLGWFGRQDKVKRRRWEAEQRQRIEHADPVSDEADILGSRRENVDQEGNVGVGEVRI